MDMNNLKLETLQDIRDAISYAHASHANPTVIEILKALLNAKKREAELMEKAKRTKASPFTEDELIVKALFVALRQHVIVNGECNAKKAFKASVDALNVKFDVELQKKLFASSIQHCATCNILKATDIEESMKSYKDSVNQSKKLLPLIESTTWEIWEIAMNNARLRAYAKQKKTVPPTEAVQEDTVQEDTVQEDTVQPTKTVITTRKNGKKKK